jgi:hypothetical protein
MSLDDKRDLALMWMASQGINEVKALYKAKRRKRLAKQKKRVKISAKHRKLNAANLKAAQANRR